jgi:hypothetical protein
MHLAYKLKRLRYMKLYKPKKEYSELQRWVSKPFNQQRLSSHTNTADELLASGVSPRTVNRSASQLGNCSTWWKNTFLIDIWESNEITQRSGALMLDYKYWEIRIHTAKYDDLSKDDASHASVVSYFKSYSLFCLLLTFNRWDQAYWLGKRIYGSNEDKCFDEWEMDRPYAGFVLRLHLIMTGQLEPTEVRNDLPKCGAYEGLFTYWYDTEALQQSIIEACDEHYIRTLAASEKKLGIIEFQLRPYSILPVEVLAYRAVRKRMGLETPLPSHPMLDAPFVTNLPEEVPPVKDDLLSKVISAASELYPEILNVEKLPTSNDHHP